MSTSDNTICEWDNSGKGHLCYGTRLGGGYTIPPQISCSRNPEPVKFRRRGVPIVVAILIRNPENISGARWNGEKSIFHVEI